MPYSFAPRGALAHLLARIACCLLATAWYVAPTHAEVPRVATDIAPVHSLVSRVMQGVAEPVLLYRPGESPHAGGLRPSGASALQSADLIVWTGEALTPSLARSIAALSKGTDSLALLQHPATRTLPSRHAHDSGHLDNDGAGAGVDPHAWLDPDNAIGWLGPIAEALGRIDPTNASRYDANARVAGDELAALTAELATTLAPVAERAFLVGHDSLQYLEDRFGLAAGGGIAYGDAASPGPATLDAARASVRSGNVRCLLAETAEDDRYVRLIARDTDARIATIDPLGIEQPPGPTLYPALMRRLATDLVDCLQP